MALLYQTGKFGAMNTPYPKTIGYYVVKYVSDSYTLQGDTTCDCQIITAGELVVRAQYMSYTKENTKLHWEQTQYQQITTVTTRTITNPCLGVVVVKEVQYTPGSVYNKSQPLEDLEIRTICITDSYHDYIIDKLLC